MALVGFAWLFAYATAKEPINGPKRSIDTSVRLREGSKITDVLGKMELAGDRTTFAPADGGEAYRLLENLALERINQILSDSREKSQWEVSGIITEFRGSNYLLVTKAVIKAAPASASPAAAKPTRSER